MGEASADDGATVPTARRLLDALPDFVLALLFAALWLDLHGAIGLAAFWQSHGYQPLGLDHPAVIAILVLEVGFLIPQVVLTDLATRLRKRPPWWLIPPLAIAALLFAPGGFDLLRTLLANQALLLVPALWSVFHRARLLWEMPGKPRLERMRVRALSAGRANVGALAVLGWLGFSLARSAGWAPLQGGGGPDEAICIVAALYFLACAFDAWRVGGPAFARRPRPLLRVDFIGVRDVDP